MKKLFNVLSKLSLVLFYFFLVFGLLGLVLDFFYIWKPDSAFTKSLGSFEPLFAYFVVSFQQQPELFSESSFLTLYLFSMVIAYLLVVLFFWYMYKLLRNIHKDSLFMYENASIFMKLGIMITILGPITEYTEGVLLKKTLAIVETENALIGYSNFTYVDTIISGVVLIIIALALKKAVHAVEENKQTI